METNGGCDDIHGNSSGVYPTTNNRHYQNSKNTGVRFIDSVISTTQHKHFHLRSRGKITGSTTEPITLYFMLLS